MAATLGALHSILRAHGLRMTQQRRVVLETAMGMRGHFSADDVLQHLQHRRRHVSRATVYRFLPMLAAAGVLREAIFGQEHVHYELALAAPGHAHLICQECGAIAEFQSRPVDQSLSHVCAAHGFCEKERRVEVVGLCESCARQQDG